MNIGFGRWLSGMVGVALLCSLVPSAVAQEGGVMEEAPKLTATTPDLPPGLEVPPVGSGTGAPSPEGLAPFGYEHFRAAAQSKAPETSSIPDYREDYRLGSGDVVGIYIWGRTQVTLSGTVGVEGTLFLRNLGLVKAAGLTLSQFQAEMDSVVHRFYRDVEVECNLLRPRQIPVWLSGEVKKPGRYVVSALATLSQVMTVAGGPTEKASLRHIRIRHSAGDTAEADLYGLLARGDRSQDLYLESGDVVFVPIKGKSLEVYGEVKRPAIFELKGGERLFDAIDLAGGFTSTAYLEKVQIVQRHPGGERRLVYLDCRDKNSLEANPAVVGDEEIVVFSAPWFEAGKKKAFFVTIEGEARFPGVYPLVEGELLSSLLRRIGGFTEKADLKQAKFIRPTNIMSEDKELDRIRKTPEKDRSESDREYLKIKLEQEPPDFIIIDFQKLWVRRDPKQDIKLRNGDRILIPQKLETVALTGRFNRPGSVVYKSGSGIEYYIRQAGGLAWNANARGMRIIKPSGQRLIPKDAGELEPGDTIWVPKKGEFNWWSAIKEFSRVGFEIASMALIIQQITK
jgi:protein involved in polysaccharide export with SLBB domain